MVYLVANELHEHFVEEQNFQVMILGRTVVRKTIIILKRTRKYNDLYLKLSWFDPRKLTVNVLFFIIFYANSKMLQKIQIIGRIQYS